MLPYTRGTRMPRLRGVRNYLNNYFAKYKRLARSRIRVKTHMPRVVGVRNYLENYCAKYKRMTLSSIRLELASPACFGLGII